MKTLISLIAALAFAAPAFADDDADHYERVSVSQADSVSTAHASLAKMKKAADSESLHDIHEESYVLEEAVKAMRGLPQIDASTQHSLVELAEKIHVQSEEGNIAQIRESLTAFERVLGAVAH